MQNGGNIQHWNAAITLRSKIYENKSIHHDVLLWDKEIPPSDKNN